MHQSQTFGRERSARWTKIEQEQIESEQQSQDYAYEHKMRSLWSKVRLERVVLVVLEELVAP